MSDNQPSLSQDMQPAEGPDTSPSEEPGTDSDQWAQAALASGVVALLLYLPLQCIPLVGLLIVPLALVPVGLGSYAWMQAGRAAQPRRARLYSGSAIVIGLVMILAMLVLFGGYTLMRSGMTLP
jgi:hypothetical protein